MASSVLINRFAQVAGQLGLRYIPETAGDAARSVRCRATAFHIAAGEKPPALTR